MMPALFMLSAHGAGFLNPSVASARRSYIHQISQREEQKEKKQVRFQARVKIHEFEKYLDDLSDGGDSDEHIEATEEAEQESSKTPEDSS